MKDMGELKSFLGIEVLRDRNNRMISLSQKGYIDNILYKYSFADANPSWTPMVMQKMGGLTKRGCNDDVNPCKEDY